MKIHHTVLGVCSIYEVVSTWPFGYEIWNIGKNNAPEGYLPFCRLSAIQPFPGGRTIETDTFAGPQVRRLGHHSGCHRLRSWKFHRDEEVHQEARTQPPQELGVPKNACRYPVS